MCNGIEQLRQVIGSPALTLMAENAIEMCKKCHFILKIIAKLAYFASFVASIGVAASTEWVGPVGVLAALSAAAVRPLVASYCSTLDMGIIGQVEPVNIALPLHKSVHSQSAW